MSVYSNGFRFSQTQWRLLLVFSYLLTSVLFLIFFATWSLLWLVAAVVCFFTSYVGIGCYVNKQGWGSSFWDAGYLRALRGVFVSFLIYFFFPGFFLTQSKLILPYLLTVGLMVYLAAFKGLYKRP